MSEPQAIESGGGGKAPKGLIPQDLLEILVCPLGKAPLRLEGETLICTNCGLKYKIEEGIPNMLLEEAELPPGVSDWTQLPCSEGQRPAEP